LLVNSSTEMMGIVAETYRKAPMVCGAEAKRRGKPLKAFMTSAPKFAQLGWATVVALHTRYADGDYRHEDRDVGVIERFCNWLIELHQTAGGHPVRPVQYPPASMTCVQPCGPHTYPQVLLKLREQFG
jgi:hypothetical protein